MGSEMCIRDRVGSGQKKPKKGEKPVVLYEMKEMRADFSYESGGGNDVGEDVPLASSSEFAFVPLDDDHSETKDTIAYVPSNLRTIENMVLRNEIAVSVTGDILTKMAIDAVRNENAKQTKPGQKEACLLYTSPSPRDLSTSRMPSSA